MGLDELREDPVFRYGTPEVRERLMKCWLEQVPDIADASDPCNPISESALLEEARWDGVRCAERPKS
jgi:hypothetical protein